MTHTPSMLITGMWGCIAVDNDSLYLIIAVISYCIVSILHI